MCESLKKFLRVQSLIEQEVEQNKKGPPEKLVQRPSVLLTRFTIYTHVLRQVEHFSNYHLFICLMFNNNFYLVDMDIGSLIREVLLGEAYIKPLKKSGNLDWVFAEETSIVYNESFIGEYVKW